MLLKVLIILFLVMILIDYRSEFSHEDETN